MNLNDAYEFFDELDDFEEAGSHPSRQGVSRKRESRKLEADARLYIRAQELAREFQFSYKAARFEEAWLLDSLIEISEQQWVSDVLRKVKGGKEASVYLCKSGAAIPGADLVAAKVYRPRSLRNLRNDGLYREGRADLDDNGRQIFDDGMLHAMEKKTEYGRELQHQSWIAYEFTTMRALHAVGADVPQPYTMAHNAILMGYVGDIDSAAPALSEVSLDRSEAGKLFERTVRNIDTFLAHERVHGDLSAYNILYWEGDITLIDFPQVISPRINRHAYTIFKRDLQRICDYFTAQGVRTDPHQLAAELWTAHKYSVPQAGDQES